MYSTWTQRSSNFIFVWTLVGGSTGTTSRLPSPISFHCAAPPVSAFCPLSRFVPSKTPIRPWGVSQSQPTDGRPPAPLPAAPARDPPTDPAAPDPPPPASAPPPLPPVSVPSLAVPPAPLFVHAPAAPPAPVAPARPADPVGSPAWPTVPI